MFSTISMVIAEFSIFNENLNRTQWTKKRIYWTFITPHRASIGISSNANQILDELLTHANQHENHLELAATRRAA